MFSPNETELKPLLWEPGYAPTENKLIKIDMDAQRQRAVGRSDLLDVFIDADFNGYLVLCATIERVRAMLLDNIVELDGTSNRVERCKG